MRNVCFILGIIFLKIVYCDLNNQSNYNILRYLQNNDDDSSDTTNNTSEPASSSTNEANTDSTTSGNNNSPTNDSTTNSDTTSSSTTSSSNTSDDTASDNPTDNTPDNNSPNTNNPSTSTTGGQDTNDIETKSKYDYLKKDYESWDDFFNNMVYDNSFSYPSGSTKTETTSEVIPEEGSKDPDPVTDTDIPKTNTTNLGRQQKAKYKSKTGSFLDDLNNPSLKLNITTLPKNIKLRMAIVVSRPGLFRPEADSIGQYQPITQTSTSSISIVPTEPKDILGMPWDPRYLIGDRGFKYAERFANQSINLYKNLKLSNFTNINETDFISVERNVSITYTQKIFQNFFKEYKNAIIESTDYTDEKLDKFQFTNKIGSKTIAYLLKDYNDLYFGFGYKTCPKFISWMNKIGRAHV